MSEPTVMRVRDYEIVVGEGVSDQVVDRLPHGVVRVGVCFPELHPELAEPVLARLSAAGLQALELPMPDGEAAKGAEVAIRCWEALGEAGFTRSDAIVTVGGGATTDMGGFIAATWLRGVAVVHVPTTVLAMVDAAVGGKTGMNTGAGKNLVGAFHEPAGVVCDLNLLHTLPREELIAGLGEVIKCGFIADPRILEVVEQDPAEVLCVGSRQLREVIERAIAVKVGVVIDDLRETGGRDGHPGREVLNYGHTMAHAIEKTTGYTVRHGEAVALGMVYVAELARRTGHIDDALAARHATTLELVGLPTRIGGLDFAELLAAMRVDKKTRGDQLRFVVLDGLALPRILSGPAPADLQAAYEMMAGVR